MADTKEETTEIEVEEQIKKQYTLHFILKPGFSSDEAHSYRKTLNDKVEATGSTIDASTCQDEARRLSYPIEGEEKGYLCESVFTGDPASIKDLYESIRGDENVLRYTIEAKRRAQKPVKARSLRRKVVQPSQTADGKSIPTSEPGKMWSPEKPTEEGAKDMATDQEPREKISIEEIDKKLDEIIKNI